MLATLELQEVSIGTPRAPHGDQTIENGLIQLRLRQVAREQVTTYQKQEKAFVQERTLNEAKATAAAQPVSRACGGLAAIGAVVAAAAGSRLREPARSPWTLWQYRKWKIAGVGGWVDLNLFYADEPAFAAWPARRVSASTG